MAVCYLVDYENVHENGLQGIDQLNPEDCVFLFFTAEKEIINLNAFAGMQNSLRVIRVPAGKQSLDMHLATHLGYLIGQETSPDEQYVIISKDSDYWGISSFWNDWFINPDKVTQRPWIADLSGVRYVDSCHPDNQRFYSRREMTLRTSIIRFMKMEGVRSHGATWSAPVAKLFQFLNTRNDYLSEKRDSGKNAVQYLDENLNDLLWVNHEQSGDIVYLLNDDHIWVPYERTASFAKAMDTCDEEKPGMEQEYSDESESSDVQNSVLIKADGDIIPNNSSDTVVEQDDESVVLDVNQAEAESQRDIVDPVREAIRAFFTHDGIDEERVRASALRDYLNRIESYLSAQKGSSLKPLDYLAETYSDLITIKREGSIYWAYLNREDSADTDDISEMNLIIDEIDEPAAQNEEDHPRQDQNTYANAREEMTNMLVNGGMDRSVAQLISLGADDLTSSNQPKSLLCERLKRIYGQKIGVKHYKKAVQIMGW